MINITAWRFASCDCLLLSSLVLLFEEAAVVVTIRLR